MTNYISVFEPQLRSLFIRLSLPKVGSKGKVGKVPYLDKIKCTRDHQLTWAATLKDYSLKRKHCSLNVPLASTKVRYRIFSTYLGSPMIIILHLPTLPQFPNNISSKLAKSLTSQLWRQQVCPAVRLLPARKRLQPSSVTSSTSHLPNDVYWLLHLKNRQRRREVGKYLIIFLCINNLC
jgi:hypothetical protein